MKEHTCRGCGIAGYSPDDEIPHEWLQCEFTVNSYSLPSPERRRAHAAVVCSGECFADLVNEHESNGAEVLL